MGFMGLSLKQPTRIQKETRMGKCAALKLILGCTFLSLGLAPIVAWGTDSQPVTLESLQKKIQEVQQEYDRKLEELRRQLEGLKRAQSPGQEQQAAKEAEGQRTAQEAEERDSGKRKTKVEEATEPVLIEAGGILLPKGTLAIEPSLSYAHFSRNSITISGFTLFDALVIGRIDVEELKRDILTGAVTLRYGLLDRLQLEAKFPYLYRRDRLVRPASTTGTQIQPVRMIEGDDLGDIETALTFHAYKSRSWLPEVLLTARGKFPTGRDPYGLETETVFGATLAKEVPTGTGHYGFSTGINLVKVFDPVVFFGSANYYWNFERNVGGVYGRIDPGDAFEYILGMAVALSERTSLNLSFQNVFTWPTYQNGDKISETEANTAAFNIGASHRFSKNVSLFGTVGIGLTRDSPDYQFQLTMPVYVDLLGVFGGLF